MKIKINDNNNLEYTIGISKEIENKITIESIYLKKYIKENIRKQTAISRWKSKAKR